MPFNDLNALPGPGGLPDQPAAGGGGISMADVMALLSRLRNMVPSMPSGNQIMDMSAAAGRRAGGMQPMMGGSPVQAATPQVAPQPTPRLRTAMPRPAGPRPNPLQSAIAGKTPLDTNALPTSSMAPSGLDSPGASADGFVDPTMLPGFAPNPSAMPAGLSSSPFSMMRSGSPDQMMAPGGAPQMNPANSAANLSPEQHNAIISLLQRLFHG